MSSNWLVRRQNGLTTRAAPAIKRSANAPRTSRRRRLKAGWRAPEVLVFKGIVDLDHPLGRRLRQGLGRGVRHGPAVGSYLRAAKTAPKEGRLLKDRNPRGGGEASRRSREGPNRRHGTTVALSSDRTVKGKRDLRL